MDQNTNLQHIQAAEGLCYTLFCCKLFSFFLVDFLSVDTIERKGFGVDTLLHEYTHVNISCLRFEHWCNVQV